MAAAQGSREAEVVVVGSGPNGLAAAITVARAGRRVVVLEANEEIGGACRSSELTLPGFVHDVGSAFHPLGLASPFMRTIDWTGHGLRWVTPPAAVAHPLDDDRAAVAWTDLDRTARDLDDDATAYQQIFGTVTRRFDEVVGFVMQPPADMVRSPVTGARIGPLLGLPAAVVARRFGTDRGRALLAGHAAHSAVPLSHPFTAGFGLLLGSAAHAVGWPFPAGGAGEMTRVLAETLIEQGGSIVTSHRVRSSADLPSARAVIFALTPRQIADIVDDTTGDGTTGDGTTGDETSGLELEDRTQRRLRNFRYGPGVCKVDYVVNGPIPWSDPDVAKAGTVHLGGTFEQVAEAEAAVAAGRAAERPFILLGQHGNFDPSRSPAESADQPVWAYCHVPNGSTDDVSDTIDAQIERFAPGFGRTVVARRVMLCAEMEAMNPNLVGGDMGGGAYDGTQAVFRPWPAVNANRLGPGLYIGSASTTPGAGVHGMGGHLAAKAALADLER